MYTVPATVLFGRGLEGGKSNCLAYRQTRQNGFGPDRRRPESPSRRHRIEVLHAPTRYAMRAMVRWYIMPTCTCSTADPAYTTFGLCRVCLSCLPSQVIGMLRLDTSNQVGSASVLLLLSSQLSSAPARRWLNWLRLIDRICRLVYRGPSLPHSSAHRASLQSTLSDWPHATSPQAVLTVCGAGRPILAARPSPSTGTHAERQQRNSLAPSPSAPVLCTVFRAYYCLVTPCYLSTGSLDSLHNRH